MIYDVIIIGAGVIGGMLARQLSKFELSICLLEKENDVAMGASKANSGIIHGGYDPLPGTLKAKLNTEGVELLFAVAEELSVPHRRNGSMVCAFSAQEEPMLEELYQRGLKNRIPDLVLLSCDEARALEPSLSPAVTRVLHVPNAGIISPYELTIAAVGNAMDNGAVLMRNFDVCAIEQKERMFTVSSAEGQAVCGTYIVNCAGGYSDRIAAIAGDPFFTIIPRAGEYMLLDKAEGTRVEHTIFQCPTAEGKGILVTPTAHGNLLVGPTAQKVASPEKTDTTPEGLAMVKRLSAKSVPSIDFRQVITSFSGVRSCEARGDFIIEASKTVPGLIHAAAIDSPGLTCSAAIAEYITDILSAHGLSLINKENWIRTRKAPNTFQNLSEDEKDAYIKANPAYGKIVCRCETISEGEILEAILTNPGARDIDGVKRRTRSGMGRCQGGFCGPHVMELISRTLHIPFEEVTKSGGDSSMVLGKVGDV